ncbi:hypothetical protein B0T11DRAFT_293985 [Plectosphaerella cucumerina]|uniref:Uncharacterized protein n=1 Tax=Plectosphaerella cucumerina TaxID=40658 RepID=A0A8K0X934_9PEZI|nr:hypothetical protein B0T11DRAFT_293985 [Plectosphaerella cucumerina]
MCHISHMSYPSHEKLIAYLLIRRKTRRRRRQQCPGYQSTRWDELEHSNDSQSSRPTATDENPEHITYLDHDRTQSSCPPPMPATSLPLLKTNNQPREMAPTRPESLDSGKRALPVLVQISQAQAQGLSLPQDQHIEARPEARKKKPKALPLSSRIPRTPTMATMPPAFHPPAMPIVKSQSPPRLASRPKTGGGSPASHASTDHDEGIAASRILVPASSSSPRRPPDKLSDARSREQSAAAIPLSGSMSVAEPSLQTTPTVSRPKGPRKRPRSPQNPWPANRTPRPEKPSEGTMILRRARRGPRPHGILLTGTRPPSSPPVLSHPARVVRKGRPAWWDCHHPGRALTTMPDAGVVSQKRKAL